jgi:hypothetical protein
MLRIALALLILPSIYAQTCSDIVLEIRGIASPAFTEYPLLNDVKQDILLILYGRERGFCPQYVVDFSIASRDFILKFDRAYALAKSEVSEDHIAAVNIAKELKKDVSSLHEMKKNFGVEAEDLANSAEELIREFLIVQAETYAREAESSDVTRKKISFYKEASVAYQAAGESLEAASNKIKQVALEEKYKIDMKKADELYSMALNEYEKSLRLLGGVLSKVNGYKLNRDAKIKLKEAKAIYSYHREKEKIIKTEKTLSDVEKMLEELRKELSFYFGCIAVFLVIFSTFLINRLRAWDKDTYDYYLGNELIQVEEREI